MLSWEANLWQDFKELFDLESRESAVSAGSSSTTQPSNSFGLDAMRFQDATFFNKDCRVVKDTSGKIIFLYSIVDENTIVLTTSTDTLKEILARINKANIITQ